MVSRNTRLKGRVVESAGIRSYRERSGPDRWHNRPGVDGVVADKAQTHCPRLERLVPKVLKNRKCLDTYELLNESGLRRNSLEKLPKRFVYFSFFLTQVDIGHEQFVLLENLTVARFNVIANRYTPVLVNNFLAFL